MKIEIKNIDNEKDFETAKKIRYDVFVNEQNVPIEQELDQFDDLKNDLSRHFLVLNEDKIPLGTARAIFRDNEVQIGRVAVVKEARGHKIGLSLMNYITNYILNDCGFNTVFLEAQIGSKGFYEKLNFVVDGEPFEDKSRHQTRVRMIKKK